MSEIVESSSYYIGIIQGKYPTPDTSTPFKTIGYNHSDLNHSSHLNIGVNPHFMIFLEMDQFNKYIKNVDNVGTYRDN
jgi:hypothetical protein